MDINQEEEVLHRAHQLKQFIETTRPATLTKIQVKRKLKNRNKMQT